MYLRDLCGTPHQVVDVVVELQLPLRCHLFDVSATEHHLVRETRVKARIGILTIRENLMQFSLMLLYCGNICIASREGRKLNGVVV